MNLYIDYGGTNFRYTYDEDLKNITSLKSKDIDLKSFLDGQIQKEKKIKFIGISIAGHVNKGVIYSTPNISQETFDVKKYVKDTYGVKLKIDNDLNCAALAEYENSGSKNLAVFYIGTGFGAGFIEDGRVVKGANNLGGEIGHIPFKKAPFSCGCGRDDCLELFVSGSGIKRWCAYYGRDPRQCTLDALEEDTDREVKEIADNFYKGLKHAFHTAVTLYDPDTVIIGGGVGKNNEKILTLLEEESKNCSFKTSRKVSVRLSALGEGSLLGAKLLK